MKNKYNAPRRRALYIYGQMRERICLLDYKPGEIIKERELASEFGVSRTPIRRVLQWLEADDLTLSVQGRGTVVTDIDLQNLKDTYFLRIKITEIIGGSVPLCPTSENIESLEKLSSRCQSISNNPDFRAFCEINLEFHKQFQSVIRSIPLRNISDKLFYQTSRMWFKLLTTISWKEIIEEFSQEIKSVERFFKAGDIESAALIHRNYLSLVHLRLDSLL